jgi:tetratricopeptide (TPR) repeat protein
MAKASGLPSEQALGLVIMVSITLGTIGFLTMYFNRRLALNVEMNAMSQLMASLSQSRQEVQKGEVDPSPESNKVSPGALKAAQAIVNNPWAGKSNRPSELVADAKAFYAVNDFEKAREVAAKALSFRPNDPEAMLYEASSILGNDDDMDEKRAAEAAKILEQFKPESAPLIVNKLLGYCYLYLADPNNEVGKAKLRRSIELSQSYLTAQRAKGLPRDMGAVLNLACAYAQLGDATNLIPLLKELVAADPSIKKRLRSLPDFAAWLTNPSFNEVVLN